MSINHRLPAAKVTARAGVESVVTVKAFERWCPEVRAAAETDSTISILDVIGHDFWTGEGVTAKRIAGALRAIGERDVIVNINSPGGDYFEGLAIYNTLREHKGKVTVKVLGLAASAASVIAMAADELLIARAGFLMIHNTWICACGDRNQLREAADWLEPFDAAAVDIYAARSGMAADAIAKMLDRETWLGGKEAVDKGFADGLLDAEEIGADAKAQGDSTKLRAAHQTEYALARMGVPRSERRSLLKSLTAGMPSAAAEDMPGAVLQAEVEGLLETIKSI